MGGSQQMVATQWQNGNDTENKEWRRGLTDEVTGRMDQPQSQLKAKKLQHNNSENYKYPGRKTNLGYFYLKGNKIYTIRLFLRFSVIIPIYSSAPCMPKYVYQEWKEQTIELLVSLPHLMTCLSREFLNLQWGSFFQMCTTDREGSIIICVIPKRVVL